MAQKKIKLFDEYKKFPIVYRIQPFVRWFAITLGTLALFYSFVYIFMEIGVDSSGIKKAFPFIIILLSLNTLAKNLFTINSVKIFDDRVQFHTLLKKTFIVPWESIKSMKFTQGKIRTIDIIFEVDGKEKRYRLLLTFSNMIEIINNIIFNAPQAELDEFINNILDPRIQDSRKSSNKSDEVESSETKIKEEAK